MKFNSETERMAHPIARRIPKHIWQNIFNQDISDEVLQLIVFQREEAVLHHIEHVLHIEAVLDIDDTLENDLEDEHVPIFFAVGINPAMRNIHFLTQLMDRYKLGEGVLICLAILLGDYVFFLKVMQFYEEDADSKVKLHAALIGVEGGFILSLYCGEFRVIRYLREKFPGVLEEQLEEEDEWPALAENGQIEILDYLLASWPKKTAKKWLKSHEYGVFRYAAANGHVSVLAYLEKKYPAFFDAMIRANNFYAFRYAADGGHLLVLNYLEEKAPELLEAMLSADDFYAFRVAEQSGHVHILKYFEQKLSDELVLMMKRHLLAWASFEKNTEILAVKRRLLDRCERALMIITKSDAKSTSEQVVLSSYSNTLFVEKMSRKERHREKQACLLEICNQEACTSWVGVFKASIRPFIQSMVTALFTRVELNTECKKNLVGALLADVSVSMRVIDQEIQIRLRLLLNEVYACLAKSQDLKTCARENQLSLFDMTCVFSHLLLSSLCDQMELSDEWLSAGRFHQKMEAWMTTPARIVDDIEEINDPDSIERITRYEHIKTFVIVMQSAAGAPVIMKIRVSNTLIQQLVIAVDMFKYQHHQAVVQDYRAKSLPDIVVSEEVKARNTRVTFFDTQSSCNPSASEEVSTMDQHSQR